VEIHSVFLDLVIILAAARVLAEVAVRLQIPSVIGELMAGVLLGPSLLGWIQPVDAIRLLAEIGITLLLFEVGLETDVGRLVKSGVKSLVVAAAGFVLPFVLGFALSYWGFGFSLLVSLFVGGTLTATSIGITVRVLTDLRRQQSAEGQVVLGAAVLDDVLGVVLLALLFEFAAEGGVNLLNTGKVLLFILVFFAVAPVAAKLMSRVIRRFDEVSEIPGLIPTTIVALVLFFAWLARVAGAPELLGGFAAGMALSRRFFLPFGVATHGNEEFASRVEAQMAPIIHLFTPVFFVAVGLSLDLTAVQWSSPFIWIFSGALFVVAVAGKIAGAFLVRESSRARIAIGMAMVPRGEVGLVFAELGRASDTLNNEVYAALVIVIAFTTLLPPFGLRWLYRAVPGAEISPSR
jgi:Kef-type K+ transport system membrane component KefB